MILFSVHDSVSNVWQEPISARNDSEAARGFMISCVNPHIPEAYLEDICLYRIGVFDEVSGTGSFHPPVKVLSGSDSNILRYRKHYNIIGGDLNEISDEKSS